MMPSLENLSVLIGASPRVGPLRRRLLQDGIRQLGVATSLPGFRRELHTGAHDLVIGCMLLDEPMLLEQGDDLRRLLADAEGFPAAFRCVGFVSDTDVAARAAELGCHCYVQHPAHIATVIRNLARQWALSRSAPVRSAYASLRDGIPFGRAARSSANDTRPPWDLSRRFGFDFENQDDSW